MTKFVKFSAAATMTAAPMITAQSANVVKIVTARLVETGSNAGFAKTFQFKSI